MEVQARTPFLGGPSVFVNDKSKAVRLHKGWVQEESTDRNSVWTICKPFCNVCKVLDVTPFSFHLNNWLGSVKENRKRRVSMGGGGGPFDGWRLKISRFDGWRLNFRSFDGWRLIFRNDVYNTNLNPNLTVSFNKTICFFSYLNTEFNPIICALKMRLLVFNYGNYVYY